MVRRHELTDQEWELLAPLIPQAATGRPRVSDRQVINGMVYKIRTGISWRDLPERYGPWQTVYTRFRRYAIDGVFTRALQQIQARADAAGDIDWLVQIDSTIVRAHQHAAATGRKGGSTGDEPDDHALGRSRGGLTTKVHLACDGKGRPLSLLVTPGQRHDSVCARILLERIRVPRSGLGRPRCRPDQVIADKAYSSRGFRAYLRRRGIAHTIPEKADQRRHRLRRGSRGGRPPGFDRETYRRRNLVERCFNRLKGFRGIATRYDKTATSYEAAVSLASLLLWARSV
ncbi:IS5 family transposase [Streptomyces sp. I4(2020)]|uniref:IS5 family transposase n=1 Tax=Streptomyces sp. I4(2020) TaxID=2760981 RepID=UPI0018EEABCB|nr:IS5 family transposase [Streptomyces sp. I4(2020)]MBJ6613740.1 IS5 family transposase [Streptomyces sp. I3(2020)]MBJ6613814.1 IS5 family transposase [Streptomyces sp. I3(2020)]MBJ6613823.1 IS5 family transposase [Streptomyces sp. I3(2020)]MBJ6613853.1 IS5 family transposase [Streptomyces sp. I3(2020)]MBJ6628792.1 IS5 family transposase [Streptomyces sp. I4(2020)]